MLITNDVGDQAWRPAVLSFFRFHQSFEANSGTVFQIRSQLLLFKTFQVLILLGKLLHSCICFSLFFVCCLKYSSLMHVKCLLSFFGGACVVFTVIVQE
jgi:hypothetical protein